MIHNKTKLKQRSSKKCDRKSAGSSALDKMEFLLCINTMDGTGAGWVCQLESLAVICASPVLLTEVGKKQTYSELC